MKKRKDPKTLEENDSTKSKPKKVVDDFVPDDTAESELTAELEPAFETAPEEQSSTEDALILDAPWQDEPPFDQPQQNFHTPDEVADEHGHRSLAANALMVLAGIIVIASLTLWAAPKLAPHLPAGVARYLLPGQIDTEGHLARLDENVAASSAKVDGAIATLKSEIAALGGRLDAATNSNQTEAAFAAAQSATDAAAALATRLDWIESELAALRKEFSAVSAALADASTSDSAATPEIAAAVASLGARLDNLAGSVAADTAALKSRLDAVESTAADARSIQSEALGEASTVIRQARLQGAIDLLNSQLRGGLPYGTKLNELAELTGVAPPSALSAAADTGLATAADLEASFGRHAKAAIAADVQASAGEGSGLQALGWLRAQVAGRPTSEQPGDGVGAITSRIGARVVEGDLAGALAEAETLPAHGQTGLGDWLDQLRARVAADTALADWRAQIGVGG